MEANEYQNLAEKTEAPIDTAIDRVQFKQVMRLNHASMGIQTESGELTDTLKKHIFYGQPLDIDNIKEELGDLLWYVALACNALDLKLSDILEANIKKLQTRFPDSFTEHDAKEENRDREREQAAAAYKKILDSFIKKPSQMRTITGDGDMTIASDINKKLEEQALTRSLIKVGKSQDEKTVSELQPCTSDAVISTQGKTFLCSYCKGWINANIVEMIRDGHERGCPECRSQLTLNKIFVKEKN